MKSVPMFFKNALKQRRTLGTKCLRYNMGVGVQVHQMQSRHTISMGSLLIAKKMEMEAPGQTKCTKSNQEMKMKNLIGREWRTRGGDDIHFEAV